MHNTELFSCSGALEFDNSDWISMSTSASSMNITVVPPRTVATSLPTNLIPPTPVPTVSSISAFTLVSLSLMADQFSVVMNTMQQMIPSFRVEL